MAHDLVAAEARAAPDLDDGVLVLLGRAETVDAGDRRDDERVPSGQQRSRGGVAQLVDLFVDVGGLSR